MSDHPPIDRRYGPPPHRQRDARGGDGYERVYQHQDDHHPDAIFVNVPGRSSTDVNRINMPIVMVVVAAIFLMGTTWVASQKFSDLTSAIERLGIKMDGLIGDLAGRVTALESKTQDRWTKLDHDYWCSRTEQINADTKWRCAEGLGQPRVRLQSDGWETIRK